MRKDITLEENKKRFQQILEFTYYGRGQHLMGEADDEQSDVNSDQAPIDGATDEIQPDNNGGVIPPNPQDGAMPQDSMAPDMSANDGNEQIPQGLNPQEEGESDFGGDISQDDFNSASPDDDVVDVSELTDVQKETEDKVEQFDAKFDKVFKALGQWEELIKSNNEKIEDLKAEFEKRNPTQVEKLSMQTAKSGPFNVKPEDYWNEKEATSNYSTEPDNNGKEQGQYVITKNDIEGNTDWKSIADSISDDILYHPTLKNTMGNL